MLISSLLIPRETYPHITDTDSLDTALDLMEHHNLRCIPILDESGTLYRGNIYKYHIYRHLAKGGQCHQSVTTLLKNATKFVYNTDSFYTLFFKLADLPHIAILNNNQQFMGIVRHNDVMTFLSQAWCLQKIGYAITLELPEHALAFPQVIKIVKSFTDIVGVMTLDRDTFILKKRVVLSLPRSVDSILLKKIIAKLEKKNYAIVEIEELSNGI